MTARAAAERFAAATDALLHGGPPEMLEAISPEVALAARLRAGAGAGIPDPSFISGLRDELRARVAASGSGNARGAVRYAVMETPIGRLALAYRDGRVLYCSVVGAEADEQFSQSPASNLARTAGTPQDPAPVAPSEAAFVRAVAAAVGVRPAREPAPPAALERAVRDHLAGRRRFRDVDLSWLPPFQRRVLEKTAEIPRGEVRPYAWIAREIGAPGAVRAVGTALGHNPIPFIIPCHRVVRSDGSLGEYSLGGPAMKERVLTLEGVPVSELVSAARRGERYRGCRTTHIVCYPTCHAARRIRPENVVPFASLAQAQAGGYRPCELCRPA